MRRFAAPCADVVGEISGKYLASTAYHLSNPFPPNWLYPPPRLPLRGIFRTLIYLDKLAAPPLPRECSTTELRQQVPPL